MLDAYRRSQRDERMQAATSTCEISVGRHQHVVIEVRATPSILINCPRERIRRA